MISNVEIVHTLLAECHKSLCHGAASVVRPSVRSQLFPLNDFFSITTRPISTKLGRKYAWRMGIQICANKGAGPFWGPVMGKIRKMLINLQKLLMNHLPECIDI